jgi:hypothetical protein
MGRVSTYLPFFPPLFDMQVHTPWEHVRVPSGYAGVTPNIDKAVRRGASYSGASMLRLAVMSHVVAHTCDSRWTEFSFHQLALTILTDSTYWRMQ